MNNLFKGNLNNDLMVYYGYATSSSASSFNKFSTYIDPEITFGIDIIEAKIQIDKLEIPINKVKITSNMTID